MVVFLRVPPCCQKGKCPVCCFGDFEPHVCLGAWGLGRLLWGVRLLAFPFCGTWWRRGHQYCDALCHGSWEQTSRFVRPKARLPAGVAVPIMSRAAKTLFFAWIENGIGYHYDRRHLLLKDWRNWQGGHSCGRHRP